MIIVQRNIFFNAFEADALGPAVARHIGRELCRFLMHIEFKIQELLFYKRVANLIKSPYTQSEFLSLN